MEQEDSSLMDPWWYKANEMYLTKIDINDIAVGDIVYVISDNLLSFDEKEIVDVQLNSIRPQYAYKLYGIGDITFVGLTEQSMVPGHLDWDDMGNGDMVFTVLNSSSRDTYSIYIATADMQARYGVSGIPNILKSVFITGPNNIMIGDFIVQDLDLNPVLDIVYDNGTPIFIGDQGIESRFDPNAQIEIVRLERVIMGG